MASVSVTELKATLSARLRQVEAGASVLVVRRGRPVARLEPVRDLNAELAEMERAGLVRVGSGLDAWFWQLPAPEDRDGRVAALVRVERDGGG